MNLEQVSQLVFNRLRNELSPKLTYHSFEHTIDVINASMIIADEEKIDENEKRKIATAALFHDTGFIYQLQNHEEKSCDIAKEMLVQYDYNANEIDEICKMIMATKVPQVANTKLEKILCDADLDYLGRDDFWEISNNLYKELFSFNIVTNENSWNLIQIKFLESHTYFTHYSIKNRNPKKLKHIETIKQKLNQI